MDKKDLVEEIDRTALDLLLKIRAEDILSEKVKAFGEIVKWAEVRQPLIPKTETRPDAKFLAIKEGFHEPDRKTRGRRGPRKASPEAGSAPVEPEPGPEPDAGSAEDLY